MIYESFAVFQKLANLENKKRIAVLVTGDFYAVAGDPISHSYSPVLYSLVNSYLSQQGLIPHIAKSGFVKAANLDWINPIKSLDTNMNFQHTKPVFVPSEHKDDVPIQTFEYIGFTVPEKMDFCLNLTSPLKHQTGQLNSKNLDKSQEHLSVNCLGISDGEIFTISTDGLGVAWIAMQNGIEIPKSTLGISGGGGTARSAMKSWIELGGRVKQVGGKRKLSVPEGSESKGKVDFLLVVDSDFSYEELSENCAILYADYSSEFPEISGYKQINGLDLLIAQHLLCWYLLWGVSLGNRLPTFNSLKKNLERIKSL